MFDFRLKRAQVALADGRLDEAFELLKDPTLRAHRAGQKLLSGLSEAFIRRGLEHLSLKRLAPALEDCNRAEKLAGNLAGVMELRSKICSQIDAARAESQLQSEQLAKAKEQMQKGWFSTGRKILAAAEENRQALSLLKNAEILETESDSAAKRIEQALKAGQVELAGRIYEKSTLHNSMSERAVDLLERIQTQARQKLIEYWIEGSIQPAESFLNQLSSVVSRSEKLLPFQNAGTYCRQAVREIENGNFDAAAVLLKKIQMMLPKVKWLDDVIRHAQSAAQAKRDLQSGPLGILENVLPEIHPERQANHREKFNYDVPDAPVIETMRANKAMQFILQMDGIGAYYVFSSDRVTLGPVSASQRSDVELVTAPDIQTKQIERVDGDYFIGDVHKGPAVSFATGRLLSDGDRVELSPRCRFKFVLPNPASSTACLIPSSARFPRVDINGVILMGREILIGPERNCHIQSGQIAERITLYMQDKGICCRTDQPITVKGRVYSPQEALPMNALIEIGELRLVLTAHHD